ncbi:MAG TPA: hypothetical protein VM802_03335 [Chitinophaga sp.]|uniref:2,3-diaminopropionate biosynthesis protein SbnB n=1 Tax=Chitinophaga sp. TaxID=1869181 RepID=UPI002C3A3F72|nr:2,3-diaminopropionate biosynthesis protein SbnB [Chitinophaga sp.]HVI43868.1 hypothetical protein [Chitinophaga sp.]
MLYLNASNINELGVDWHDLTTIISKAVTALHNNDYAQPIKPYLRYGHPRNRIIAMPAYVGGSTPLAGIKWIASFPENIYHNKPRAHSVTILNEHDSGIPLCVINTAAISAIRTAAVSGAIVQEYLSIKDDNQRFTVAIMGFGPIGQTHLKMITALLGERIERIFLYDIHPVDLSQIDPVWRDKVQIAGSWQEAYLVANIFITCTVSSSPYVDLPPVKGSLQLNVSLRDYQASMRSFMDIIIVDDWDEVCRENTDIENMHKTTGLEKGDTLSIADIIYTKALQQATPDAVIMFNPMGMAIFDIAVGGYYYNEAMRRNAGTVLPD